MPKDFYMRTMQAGRYFKAVRYQRSLPNDSSAVRAAKAATTSRAQRYINLKNSAEKLQMLLCANFDDKAACFCTYTFSEENLPVNRKMVRNLFVSHLSALRRKMKRLGKDLRYIYNIEGASLLAEPDAVPTESLPWEILPWKVKSRWEAVDKQPKGKKKKHGVRLHIHCFLLLTKPEREMVKQLWPYGFVYINPMKVELEDTFYRLSYYVTKEARSGSKPSGTRSYVPSRNLEQPVVEGHWCDGHEVLMPPPEAEHVHTANETTEYASFQYCSYRLPRPKRQPKEYRSKGRL